MADVTRGNGKGDGLGHFRQGHLDWISVAAVLLVYVVTKAFLSFPNRMAKSAQTAAWSVPLFSAMLSVVWVVPLLYVLSKHPGRNLIEVTQALAGKPTAFVLGAVLYTYNIGLVATEAREIGEALATVILPLTPLPFTLAALFGTGLYVAVRGTEVVGRLALLVAASMLIYVVLLSLLSMVGWSGDAVFPLLGPGIRQLLVTYGVRQSIYGELLALGLLAPYVRNKGDLGKAAAVSGGTAAVLLSIAVIACQMMFPHPSLMEVPVPFLRVIRLIYLSRFFQRFDAFFVVLWMGAGSLLIAIGACVSSHIVGSLLPLRSYPIAVWATVVVCFAGSILITSFSQAIIIEFDIIRPYSVFLFMGWPFLLLILQFLRGEKKRPEADTSDQAGV